MSLLDLSAPRLEKAVKKYVRPSARRWIDNGPTFTVRSLMDTLIRRGMSERDVHSLFGDITKALEPAGCTMSHCKSFGGSGAPNNCCLERVPGRCSILIEFKKRKADRDEQTKAKGGTK